MRQEFYDYFEYALQIQNGNAWDVPECRLNSECDNGSYVTKCCSKAVMTDPMSGETNVEYRCMSKGVAQFNLDMNIGDFKLQMKCLNDGASKLVAGVLAAAAVASTLF